MKSDHEAGHNNAAEPPLDTNPLPSSENKIFKKWRREFSLLTGYGIDPEKRVFTINRRNCERWKRDLLNYSMSVLPLRFSICSRADIGPPVQFMLKHLKLAGVDLTSAHVPCLPCDLTRSGGFSPDAGAVVLCQGNFLNKKHVEHTLVHELLHMYDHAVFNVDWSNLRYHACSEIRANSLSGDCSWGREIQRGKVSFSKQHQACVRRRAVMSVMANPNCQDRESAERAVNEVWESCFNDTRPFDEIY
ncbi:metalloprotease ATP23 [Russula compacta]|nr:metalloprotease ATP23 [Russula compacta]